MPNTESVHNARYYLSFCYMMSANLCKALQSFIRYARNREVAEVLGFTSETSSTICSLTAA